MSLARQVLGFLPSQVVPALASFASIYLFTRHTSPGEYGIFALVMSVVLMAQSVLFYWIQVAVTRHVDAAQRDGQLPALQASAYRCLAGTWLAFSLLFAAAMWLLPLAAELKRGLWLAIPIVGLRSLVVINQAFNRGALRTWRYNLIESGHAVGQLALGWALLQGVAAPSVALLCGTLAAGAAAAAVDVPTLWAALKRGVARAQVLQLLQFGAPLSLGFALNYVLATSDRLLVQWLLGAEAVGVYAVAYGLMDRAVSALFIAISIASYPLAIRAFETGGAAAAQAQMRRTGELLLFITLPVCAALMCLNQQLAAVLVGEAFRADAARLMPWVALAALLAGFQIHFFDHAFHLERRTSLFLWTIGPAALVNVLANLVLLPQVGLIGAAWATLLGYACSLAASVVIGARVFKVPLALGQIARAGAATALMLAVLWARNVPGTVWGLLQAVALGGAVYLLAAWVCNVAGLRGHLSLLTTRLRGA